MSYNYDSLTFFSLIVCDSTAPTGLYFMIFIFNYMYFHYQRNLAIRGSMHASNIDHHEEARPQEMHVLL